MIFPDVTFEDFESIRIARSDLPVCKAEFDAQRLDGFLPEEMSGNDCSLGLR